MISVYEGKPFAEIVGGEDDGTILRITENIQTRKPSAKEVDVDDGILVPVCDPSGRQIIYMAGPEGVGKSHLSAEYAESWADFFPNNNFWVFSRKPVDEVIDNVPNCRRIILDDRMVKDPVDFLQEMKTNDLCLFDDIDTINDKKIQTAVYKLEADIIDVGRAHKIYIISTSHLINGTDQKRTRTLLNSAHYYVVFPISNNVHQIRYLLEKYVGMKKNQIEEVLETDSRWLFISRKHPIFLFGQTYAYLLK